MGWVYEGHGRLLMMTPCFPRRPYFRYRGMIHAATSIIRMEGIGALYRGLLPNYIKVIPSVSISFLAFEHVKEHLSSVT